MVLVQLGSLTPEGTANEDGGGDGSRQADDDLRLNRHRAVGSSNPEWRFRVRAERCRVCVDLRGLSGHSLHALRLSLTADVLRRFLEVLEGRQVVLAIIEPEDASTVTTTGVGIRDPEARVTSLDEATAVLGGAPTFLLKPSQLQTCGSYVGLHQTIWVEAVIPPAHAGKAPASVLGNHDPAALRLLLLRFAHTCPAIISTARLHRAEETLQRWRYKVAMWADMRPGPIVSDIVSAARDSLGASLDTVAVLKNLHRLEVQPHIPSGSKFETFAYLDRVLALDLCYLVGKLRR